MNNFTHTAYGITVQVVVNNEKVLGDRVLFTNIPDVVANTEDNCIYVNEQFMKLDEDTRNVFLVSQSAHFALGHNFPVDGTEEKDRLEEEAMRWAVQHVGLEAYAGAATDMFMRALPQYKTYMEVPEFSREEAINEFIEYYKTHYGL